MHLNLKIGKIHNILLNDTYRKNGTFKNFFRSDITLAENIIRENFEN
jgi:hypothetical protein